MISVMTGGMVSTTSRRELCTATISLFALMSVVVVACSTEPDPPIHPPIHPPSPTATHNPSPTAEVAGAIPGPLPAVTLPGTTPIPIATPVPELSAPTDIPAALASVVAEIESLVERELLTREAADIHICNLLGDADCPPPERVIGRRLPKIPYDQISDPDPATIASAPLALGAVRHYYATATTSSRRIVEMDDRSLHAVWWEGGNIVGRSAADGITFGPAIQLNNIAAATGVSMAAASGSLHVVYADAQGVCAFGRFGPDLLHLDEPQTIYCSDTEFTVQWPSISIAPDGFPWIVFRSAVGESFPVFVLSSNSRGWSLPLLISTTEQQVTGGAGTTGAVFFPGGRPLVLHTGKALYASTLNGQHEVVADNYRGDGTHGFSGVVMHDRLLVAYSTDGFGAEIRTFTWSEGWTEPTLLPDAFQRSLGLIDVAGTPVVVGYDKRRMWWYIDGAVYSGPELTLVSSLMYLATPDRSTEITMMWQDGVRPGAVEVGEVYFWRGP